MKPAPKILLFIIFLSAFANTNAQTNFLKAYYITVSGDTVHGLIDYRSERRNYKVCVFKKDAESKPVQLLPEDIRGFALEQKVFYERHTLDETNGEQLTGFFKVIIRGKLSLLRYGSRQFAMNENGQLFEISYRTEVVDRSIREDYRGLGFLISLMGDCPDTSPTYLKKIYNKVTDFTALFKKYNACVGSSFHEMEDAIIKPHVSLGVQATAGRANLEFRSGIPTTFDPEILIGIGAVASVFLPRVDENMRLVIEVNYNTYNGYAHFSSENAKNDIFLERSKLNVPVVIRYDIDRFFVDIGIQNQFILDQNLRWRVEERFGHQVFTRDVPVVEMNKWSKGFVAGLGVKYKIANFKMRSFLRFSQMRNADHVYNPVLRSIDLNVAVQLNK